MTNENETNTLNTENSAEQAEGSKTYSEAEVAELLQRETDRRVTSALAKQKKDYEQKLSLSKLDEASRATAEKDLKIQELTEKLAAFEIEKNRSELKSVLSAHGLSAEFCDLVHVTDDLEESQAKIDKLEKLFKAAVSEEVKRRLNSSVPTVGTGEKSGAPDFAHMSLEEKNQLFNSNPDLYRSLSGR